MKTGRCQDAVPLLGPLNDGELDSHDRAWLEAHLAGCASCGVRRTFLSAQAEALRQHVAARAGQADFSFFTARVMARVAADRRPSFADRASVWAREVLGAHRYAFGAGAGFAAAAALALSVGLRPSPVSLPSAEGALALASASRGVHAPEAEQDRQADIEELEVYGQEGVVLQIPGQSTVIWVTEPGRAGSGQ